MKKSILHYLFVFFAILKTFGQTTEQPEIDLSEARKVVDSLDKAFSKHFFEGDSLALYTMYAKGALFGSKKGEEILSSWGSQIRDAIKNDTRTLRFTTTGLTTDNEYLIEVGTYEFKNTKGKNQGDGKYLLVWKKEEGDWKIYRDIGL
jgi:ketosteroid isomerase-like protein